MFFSTVNMSLDTAVFPNWAKMVIALQVSTKVYIIMENNCG